MLLTFDLETVGLGADVVCEIMVCPNHMQDIHNDLSFYTYQKQTTYNSQHGRALWQGVAGQASGQLAQPHQAGAVYVLWCFLLMFSYAGFLPACLFINSISFMLIVTSKSKTHSTFVPVVRI